MYLTSYFVPSLGLTLVNTLTVNNVQFFVLPGSLHPPFPISEPSSAKVGNEELKSVFPPSPKSSRPGDGPPEKDFQMEMGDPQSGNDLCRLVTAPRGPANHIHFAFLLGPV